MSRSPDTVSQGIRNKCKTTIPGLSLELGTVERKIVDACAEAISESDIDQYLVGSLFDIAGKAGLELEQFVGTFGFGRLQGRQSTGVVRVELSTAQTQDVSIALGTQFFTGNALPGTGNPMYFAATQSVVLVKGNLAADVPVQCTIVGSAGNLPPDSITSLGSILGATSVTNLTAMTGGVDIETDDELRQRFQDQLLRNVAGTEDWYRGIATQNKFVSKIAVFGPYQKYETEITVPASDGTLTLDVVTDVKYAWPESAYVFKNLAQTDEVFYRPSDDFDFVGGTSPQIHQITSGDLTPSDVVSVEFDYTTRASRNDPANSITNKVDMFVNGVDPFTVTERTIVSAAVLSASSANVLHTGRFIRVGSSGSPAAGNRFTRLGSVPIVSFPSTLVIGGDTYVQGTDYHILRPNPDVSGLSGAGLASVLLKGSQRETSGIEWTGTGPDTDTQISLTYVYNRIPEVLNTIVKKAKQITTDVLVHEATYKYLRVYLSIEYDRGYVPAQVNNSLNERFRLWMTGFKYGSWVEISDILTAAHQVLGVDNVTLTTSSEDVTNYGIKAYNGATDPSPDGSPHTQDFKLPDNTLPIFLEAIIRRKPNR